MSLSSLMVNFKKRTSRAPLKIEFGHELALWNKAEQIATMENINY
jgi:hypothetical protein